MLSRQTATDVMAYHSRQAQEPIRLLQVQTMLLCEGLTRSQVELVSMVATCSPRPGLLAGRDLGPGLAGWCLCAKSAAALGPPAHGLLSFAACPLDSRQPEDAPLHSVCDLHHCTCLAGREAPCSVAWLHCQTHLTDSREACFVKPAIFEPEYRSSSYAKLSCQ